MQLLAEDSEDVDSIPYNGQRFQVLAIEDDRALAARTYYVEHPVMIFTDETKAECELAEAGRYRVWPVLNRAHAKCFWSQAGLQTLSHASLSGSGEGRSVTVDLVSDLIGPVRAYVIGSVAAATAEEENDDPEAEQSAGEGEQNKSEVDANVQRFLTSGGNAVLGLEMPGPFFRTYGTNLAAAPNFMAYLLLAPRVGFDVPNANSSASNPKVNLDLGPEFTMAAHGDQLALFSQLRYGLVVGSPEFYDGLSLTNNAPFVYGRVNFGLRIRVVGDSNVLLSWSKAFSGPDQLLQSGSQLNFTLQKQSSGR